MSDVKRYTVPGRYLIENGKNPGAQDVVLASDYAALESELAKLKGEYEWVASINTALDESNQSAWGELARLRAGHEPVASISWTNDDPEWKLKMLAEPVHPPVVPLKLYTTPQPSAMPDGWTVKRASDDEIIVQHESIGGCVVSSAAEHPRQIPETILYHLAETMLAAAPSTPATVQGDAVRPLYTCIGKGGEYRYLGTAIGAGDSRGELVEVYQDENGHLYHRTPEDFMERMEPIAAARQGGGKV